MFDDLENINLVTPYQKNQIIIGSALFIIMYTIYRTVMGDVSLTDVIYSGFAFGLSYLSITIFYNYIKYFNST